jgi:hypothetical protein
MLADADVTVMESKVADVTSKLADAVFPPETTEIIELPVAKLLASPDESIFADEGEEEDQLAVVIGSVVPSE